MRDKGVSLILWDKHESEHSLKCSHWDFISFPGRRSMWRLLSINFQCFSVRLMLKIVQAIAEYYC